MSSERLMMSEVVHISVPLYPQTFSCLQASTCPRLSLLFSKINPESLQAMSTGRTCLALCFKGMKSVYPLPVANVGVSVSVLVYLCEPCDADDARG